MAKNYDKIYKELKRTFHKGDIEKANAHTDEIIKERPYFKKPDIYWYKLECLHELACRDLKRDKRCKDAEAQLRKSKSYRKAVKENVENYLFSYYLNVDEEKVRENCETGIIFEWWYPDQDRWKFIKLLKLMMEHDIKTKRFAEGGHGDVCHVFIGQLLDIYEYYGEDKKSLKHLESNYFAYSGLRNYHTYLEEQSDPSLQDYVSMEKDYAKRSFELALKVSPDNPIANYGLGRYYYEVERNNEKARELLQKAEQSFILIWEPYYYLGKIYVEKADYEKAKEYYILTLKLYKVSEADGIDTLKEECIEDLNPLGGCKTELEEAIKEEPVEKDKLLPSKTQIEANIRLISVSVLKEFRQQHFESFKKEIFGELWDNISKSNQQQLEWAEMAFYCFEKSQYSFLRPPLAKSWTFYYAVLFDEIVEKIFFSYKKGEWPKMPPEEKKRNLYGLIKLQHSANDPIGILKKCLSEENTKYTKPTLGQLLNILSRPSEINVIISDIKNYAFNKSKLLTDKAFCDMLDAIKNKRNAIEHSSSQKDDILFSDFAYFRENIIGTNREKGLLPRFLESLELKLHLLSIQK